MKDEGIQIIKGIALVILTTTIAIFFSLKVLNKNYIYSIKYYTGENLYTMHISKDYHLKMDISVICTEEKCLGKYNNVITTTNGVSKKDVKKLVKIFDLTNQKTVETNEEVVSKEQKEIITKIIK